MNVYEALMRDGREKRERFEGAQARDKAARTAPVSKATPCGWRWLDSWVFRKRVPNYSTPAEWGPVYDQEELDAEIERLRQRAELERAGLRRLLQNCKSAMRASQARPGLRTDWTHMIDAIDEACALLRNSTP